MEKKSTKSSLSTRRLYQRAKRAAKCESGLAATEFALVLPIMVLMFFGLAEGSDALSADRRVSIAVNTMADLVAQSTTLSSNDAVDLFTGVERILEPKSIIEPEFRLLSVISSGGNPVIHWSIDSAGAEPYAPGLPYTELKDPSLLDAGASLIIVELTYFHQPALLNRVFDETIEFRRLAKRWPRQSSRIQFCVSENNCTS